MSTVLLRLDFISQAAAVKIDAELLEAHVSQQNTVFALQVGTVTDNCRNAASLLEHTEEAGRIIRRIWRFETIRPLATQFVVQMVFQLSKSGLACTTVGAA